MHWILYIVFSAHLTMYDTMKAVPFTDETRCNSVAEILGPAMRHSDLFSNVTLVCVPQTEVGK